MIMKKFVFIFFFGIIIADQGLSQNLDSMLMDDFSGLNKKIDRLVYSLETGNNKLIQANDSLIDLNKQLSEKLLEIEAEFKNQTSVTNKVVTEQSSQVKTEISELKEKMQPRFGVLYILLGLALLLILYLMIILRISRRESIEYLLSQTDGLSQQNYEILEKARELKKIKKSVKELINDQKAEEKKKKKSKKKGKK